MRAYVRGDLIRFRCGSVEEAKSFYDSINVGNFGQRWHEDTSTVDVPLWSAISLIAALCQRELGCNDAIGYQIAAWLLFAERCPDFKALVKALRGTSRGVTNSNAETMLLREIYRSPLLRQIEIATRFLSTDLIPYWSRLNETN